MELSLQLAVHTMCTSEDNPRRGLENVEIPANLLLSRGIVSVPGLKRVVLRSTGEEYFEGAALNIVSEQTFVLSS